MCLSERRTRLRALPCQEFGQNLTSKAASIVVAFVKGPLAPLLSIKRTYVSLAEDFPRAGAATAWNEFWDNYAAAITAYFGEDIQSAGVFL